jgi:phosphogluconate dehydratase
LAYLEDGDVIVLDAGSGRLECQVAPEIWSSRQLQSAAMDSSSGIGREYFGVFRQAVTGAEEGASVLFPALAGAD